MYSVKPTSLYGKYLYHAGVGPRQKVNYRYVPYRLMGLSYVHIYIHNLYERLFLLSLVYLNMKQTFFPIHLKKFLLSKYEMKNAKTLVVISPFQHFVRRRRGKERGEER